uniref:Transposase n=1 Tax=Macrostomum lignano TaxID=282301 RepID=A0A1I8FEU5_9PLAT
MTAGPSQCPARRLATQLSLPVHAWQPTGFQFDQFDIGVVASFGRSFRLACYTSIRQRIRQGGVSAPAKIGTGWRRDGANAVLTGWPVWAATVWKRTLDDLPAARRAAVSQADLPYARSLAKRPDPTFRPPGLVLYERGQVDGQSGQSDTPGRCAVASNRSGNSSRTSRSAPSTLGGHRRVNLGQASELPDRFGVDLDSGLMLIGCSDGGWRVSPV